MEISKEKIEEGKDQYDDLLENILDTVYNTESLVTANEWKKIVIDKCSWIVEPELIR